MTAVSGAGQRVDKWLWYARFFKTRSLAAKMVADGKVRLAAGDARPERVTRASHLVRVGDVLTFPQGPGVRVVRVLAPGTRRGPAAEAQALYEDKTPRPARGEGGASPRAEPPARREPGAGRPTKRDRRALDRFRDTDPTD